ncbi:Receptor-like serine/threonine-protein kinase ALE2 [Platanthera guangdongensis]|uniref:Receptor-like serine/threonine-protein kinase ALE2 n=1 Tax=Platanthera guangdongensis TaxID=2320717 RepID=A0ABR2LG56_9ASPA
MSRTEDTVRCRNQVGDGAARRVPGRRVRRGAAGRTKYYGSGEEGGNRFIKVFIISLAVTPLVASPSPWHPPIEIPKINKRHLAPPDIKAPVVNPSASLPPLPTIMRKPYAPSPQVEGPVVKRAHSRPPVETPKKPNLPPATSPTTRQKNNRWPKNHPAPSPSYFTKKPPSPLPQPILSLPPPPPNFNCGPMTCHEPLVNPSPGSPCACVLPIKVGLTIGVALYTFFPLVSEFAQEIASGIFVRQSQVRIMGANTAFKDPEKTIVLVDLVPLGQYFDNTTVFLIYEKLWQKQVAIRASYFGDYDVSYVLYPGLPLAPPTAPAYVSVEGGAYSNDNNGRAIRPLGVDVMKREKKQLSGSMMAIIVLSSVISMILIVGVAWFLLRRHWEHSDLPSASSQSIQSPFAKLSATHADLEGNVDSLKTVGCGPPSRCLMGCLPGAPGLVPDMGAGKLHDTV